MEKIPTEILVNIFKQLCITDLENCSVICLHWQEIICQYFLGPQLCRLARLDDILKTFLHNQGWTDQCSDRQKILNCYQRCGNVRQIQDKILVMGGKDFDGFCNVEIVHLTNSKIKCSILPGSALDQPLDLPIGEGCFGGFFHGKIFVGGGRHNRKYPNYYQIFGINNVQRLNMIQTRCNASCVQLDDTSLWIVGGDNHSHDTLKSTEFIALDKCTNAIDYSEETQTGPEIPFSIYDHCILKFNENSIYLIGGEQNDKISNKTWIVDSGKNFQITEGPPLNRKRKGHCCAKFENKAGKILFVVAGGFDGATFLDSVEILDPLSDQGWKYGPNLPLKISGSQMISSPEGTGVILVGGYFKHMIAREGYSNTLYEWNGDFTSKWRRLEQTLQFGRKNHLVIPLPDKYVKCDRK